MWIIDPMCRLWRNQQVSNSNTLLRPSRLFIAISFVLSPFILEAQEISIGNDDDQPIEERIIYNRESTLHATLHSRGLGFGFKTGKIRSILKTTYWDFEVSYIRSQKQVKQLNINNLSTFVYGKLNDLLSLRGGYEVERRIYGKPYWGGVELRWLYEGGASLGFLKPYYEGLPFWKGINELKLRPGIYAKGGMSFEIGISRTNAQSIEMGAVAEYFPQGVNLMDKNPTEYVILTLYLSYNWGTRYNK